MKARCLLGAVLVALAPGCRPKEAAGTQVHAAWEEGLTLGFESPALAGPQREASRFQKQVTRTAFEGDTRKVEITYTSLQGRLVLQMILRGGGVQFLDGQGRPQVLLPEGFPDRTPAWESATHRFTVLGRARWARTSPVLPAERSRDGVWLEASPLKPGGVRMRVFYLPEVGEAESCEWRDGRWVTTNLLVSRGFTEVPRVREAP